MSSIAYLSSTTNRHAYKSMKYFCVVNWRIPIKNYDYKVFYRLYVTSAYYKLWNSLRSNYITCDTFFFDLILVYYWNSEILGFLLFIRGYVCVCGAMYVTFTLYNTKCPNFSKCIIPWSKDVCSYEGDLNIFQYKICFVYFLLCQRKFCLTIIFLQMEIV